MQKTKENLISFLVDRRIERSLTTSMTMLLSVQLISIYIFYLVICSADMLKKIAVEVTLPDICFVSAHNHIE